MTCLGKIIGGGMPLAAYGGRREIMQKVAPLGPVYQAGTLSGNPLAMTAGLATLYATGEPGFYERLEDLGDRWRRGMQEVASEGDVPFTINQLGSMASIFFTEGPVTDFASASRSDTEAFKDFFWHMLQRGIYLAPSQYEAGFISAVHSEEDLEKTFEAARDWFARASAGAGRG
jgi:glutamate-1-semialdehyde 2,1-aminomutase